MTDITDWQAGYEAGFAAGFRTAQQPTHEQEEIRIADTELQTRFGVFSGSLVRVYRNEDGEIVGAVTA